MGATAGPGDGVLARPRGRTPVPTLLRWGEPLSGGACGRLKWKIDGETHAFHWESRANAVWRHGRVFLRCNGCSRLATRLYLPDPDTFLACRRCWGLTYESQTKRNYKEARPGGLSAQLGVSPRSIAHDQTMAERERQAAASWLRWAERRGQRDKAASG